jgi:hypothetical protein
MSGGKSMASRKPYSKRQYPNWQELDPSIDRLLKEQWTVEAIAKDLGIKADTIRAHLRKREAVQIPVQTMSIGAEQSADTGADQLFNEPKTQEPIPVQRPVHDSTPSLDTSAENGADDSADESQVLFIPPTPVQTAVQRFDTGPVQILDTDAVQRIDQLEDDVRQLTHMMRSVMDRLNDLPVQTPVQITATPPYPRGRSVRWNLWVLEPIRDEIATLAAERDVSPSQLVQEVLWKALSERRQQGV